MKIIYDYLSAEISAQTTKHYSTSFSIGIRSLDKNIRKPIYQIYGFVRIADEIVDSFHDFDKKLLLDEFEIDLKRAIERRISTNPILNSFQEAFHTYNIDMDLVDSFMKSMRMDLNAKLYDTSQYDDYIYGSAEAVGLMCLHVFVHGDKKEYQRLAPQAKMLGSAFQKINFLRDINADAQDLGRVYFPDLNLNNFTDEVKEKLLKEIDVEFEQGLLGIKNLPKNAKFGVYVAYIYYKELSNAIRKMPAAQLLKERARVSNPLKLWLLIKSYFKYKLFKI
jgi:phytoene synthase